LGGIAIIHYMRQNRMLDNLFKETIFVTQIDGLERKFVPAEISLLTAAELLTIDDQEFHRYEWKEFRVNLGDIWKLSIENRIAGLVRLLFDDFDQEVEIRYLEVSPKFQSKNIRYSGIGGTLIAFSCRESLRTFSGNIRVLAASDARALYLDKCGFTDDGCFLRSDEKNSHRIIERYLITSVPGS
jgi:hypothetical protein